MVLNMGAVGKALLVAVGIGVGGFAILKVAGTFYEPIAWLPDYLWGGGIWVYENAVQVPLSIAAAGGTLVAGLAARFAQGKKDLETGLNTAIEQKDSLLQARASALDELNGEKIGLETQFKEASLQHENELLATNNEWKDKVIDLQGGYDAKVTALQEQVNASTVQIGQVEGERDTYKRLYESLVESIRAKEQNPLISYQ